MASLVASISELKKNPLKVLREGEGKPVAIVSLNQTAFYCIPADLYEQLVEMAEDREDNAIADVRLSDGQESVRVPPRDL